MLEINYINLYVFSIIIFFVILIQLIKKMYYNRNFKLEIIDTNILKYNKILKQFFDDIKKYNDKLKKYVIISYFSHYLTSIMYIYIVYIVLYYLYKYTKIISKNLEIVFYIISGIELLILLLSVLFNKTNMEHFSSVNSRNRSKNITLLVAFGGSNLINKLDILNKLIDNSLNIFSPSNIIICYNYSNVDSYNDDIVKFVKNKGVNIVCIPFPNKSYAITYTSLYFVKTEYLMIIDDDVFLPTIMNIPIFSEETNTDIWGYMICAEKPLPNASIFSKYLTYCQDIEYRFAGFVKQFQSYFNKSSTLSHHGAISLYKKNIFDKIMSIHDCVFDGEDYLMGILAYMNNYKMSIVSEQYISTKVPDNISALSIQRIVSWDYVILKYVYENLYVLFKFENKNYVTKLIAFFHIWTIYGDFIRIPNLIFLSLNSTSIYILIYILISFFIKSICILIILYIKNTFNSNCVPINYGIFMIIGYPLYSIYSTILRLIAQIRYLLYFDKRIHNNVLFKHRPLLPCITNYINNIEIENIDWKNIYNINNDINVINK